MYPSKDATGLSNFLKSDDFKIVKSTTKKEAIAELATLLCDNHRIEKKRTTVVVLQA